MVRLIPNDIRRTEASEGLFQIPIYAGLNVVLGSREVFMHMHSPRRFLPYFSTNDIDMRAVLLATLLQALSSCATLETCEKRARESFNALEDKIHD